MALLRKTVTLNIAAVSEADAAAKSKALEKISEMSAGSLALLAGKVDSKGVITLESKLKQYGAFI